MSVSLGTEKGEFHQSLIPPYTHRIDSLETTIIQLYEKGITTREIADLIEKCMAHIIVQLLFLTSPKWWTNK